MKNKKYKHAFIIGKFLPPHKGHLMLVDFALSMADTLTVAVEQQSFEDIDVDQRVLWLNRARQDNRVEFKALYGSYMPEPPEDLDGAKIFWKNWNEVITGIAPDIDVLVSADDYGRKLAQGQNIDWLPVDRSILPISASLFKEKPWDRYPWLIEPARVDLIRRMVIVGAESTGKSYLAEKLAHTSHTPTIHVPEYAEHWIRRHAHAGKEEEGEVIFNENDFITFLNGQSAYKESMKPLANKWMVEDSHALTTAVWAQYMGFDDLAEKIYDIAKNDKPHHVILSSIKGAIWKPDIHRPTLSDLEFFENTFKNKMDQWGWEYDIVEGDWNERTLQGINIRDRFLDKWQNCSWNEWCSNNQTHKDINLNLRKNKP